MAAILPRPQCDPRFRGLCTRSDLRPLYWQLHTSYVRVWISIRGTSYWVIHRYTTEHTVSFAIDHVNCLLQDCGNSSANALELLQSCTKPSIYDSLQLCRPHRVLVIDRMVVVWDIGPFLSSETMMTLSNGNIFRVTGHLCGEFTGLRWIPHTKAGDAELRCFLWSALE